MDNPAGLSLAALPPTIRELAGEIGLAATMALVENFGGLTLKIPLGETKPGRDALEDLSSRIGEKAASLIAARYGGTRLYVPNCKQALIRARDIAMLGERRKMESEGMSGREIVMALARRHNLSDRYVWRILRRDYPANDESQARLPGFEEA